MKHILFLTLLSLTSCGWSLLDLAKKLNDGASSDDARSLTVERVIEPTKTLSLALGGVAPGRDELILVDENGNERTFPSGVSVECTAAPAIVTFQARPTFTSLAEGGGALLTAISAGVAEITCTASGTALPEKYEVTIPPQELVQILVGEARTQIDDEATIENERVALTSRSATAEAIGVVIRNRINLINEQNQPSLFNVSPTTYDAEPPVSYYTAVINAPNQFSPTSEDDPSHSFFSNAQDRNFLSSEWHIAYDQAVLIAAGIFNGDITDSTGGAFAFRSPNASEWGVTEAALASGTRDLPEGSGVSDANFPALAPVQILVHPDVASFNNGRPTFIFTRSRSSTEPAVTDTP